MNTETKVEKEVRVKKRQRYIWPEAQFVRLMHRFRCEVRVAYQNREVDDRSRLIQSASEDQE